MPFTFRRHVFWYAIKTAWPFWLALVGVVGATAVAGAFVYFTSANAVDGVRYTGTLLEVFGVASVAHGLQKIQTSFGLPPFGTGFRSWLDLLASAFRLAQPVSATATMSGGATMSGRVRATVQAGPLATLEHRVEVLEANLSRLYTELDDRFGETARDLAVLKDEISAERQTRDAEIRKLGADARDRAVDGIRLELVGVLWVALGCLAANLPLEIAKLLTLGE